MKILWITPNVPYPVEDGAKRATEALLCSLSVHSVELHLVTTDSRTFSKSERSEIVEHLGLKSLEMTYSKRRPYHRLLTQPLTPLTMVRFTSSSFRELLEAKRKEGGWDVIIYDGLHPAAHSISSGAYRSFWREVPVVYRAHNVESEIWNGRTERCTNIVVKMLLRLQSALVKRFEKSVLSQVSHTATVSQVDSYKLSELFPGSPSTTVPIGMDFSSLDFHTTNEKKQVLFVGKLDWKPNQEGLQWFLEEVWPTVYERRPDLRFVIVGSGDVSLLAPYLDQGGVEYVGRVKSVTPYYKDSLISIVPIFYGSGTRVKVIESVASGCPVLSTTLGAEGLEIEPDSQFLCEDSSQGWIAALEQIKPDKAALIAKNAYQSLEKKWSRSASSEQFIGILASLQIDFASRQKSI